MKKWILEHVWVSKEGRQCAKLLSIKQEGRVAEYQQNFEATPLPQLSEEALESAFLNGLDSFVRAEVLVMEPQGLEGKPAH